MHSGIRFNNGVGGDYFLLLQSLLVSLYVPTLSLYRAQTEVDDVAFYHLPDIRVFKIPSTPCPSHPGGELSPLAVRSDADVAYALDQMALDNHSAWYRRPR
jgi:hypothetical protein